MEQLLLSLFYPIGWCLIKTFTLGKARPEKWNWKQFFEVGENEAERSNPPTISYRKTAGIGLISTLVILVIYSLKQYL
jgi:hypothetical protein